MPKLCLAIVSSSRALRLPDAGMRPKHEARLADEVELALEHAVARYIWVEKESGEA
jgi:hypothetical protein